MLKEPLFSVLTTDHQENVIHAVLEINGHSEIFEGHFPGQPVVPGACMLQLIKEILIRTLSTPLRLLKADNIKFMNLVEPGNAQVLLLDITYQQADNDLKVTANLSLGDVVCMKFQGTFQ